MPHGPLRGRSRPGSQAWWAVSRRRPIRRSSRPARAVCAAASSPSCSRPRGSPTSSCCSLPSRCCSVRRLSFSCGSSNPRPTACRSSASCCSFPWSRPSRDRSGWAYRPRATSAATSRCSAASCCSTCPLRGCCCAPAARRRRSWRCASRSMWRRSACGSTSLPAARDSRRRYLRDVLRPAAAVTLLAVPLPLLVSLATQGWTQLLATTAVSTLSLALCLPAAGLLPCERRLLLRTLKKHFGCHA